MMHEKKLVTSIKNSSEFENWLFSLLSNQEQCVRLGRQSKKIVETQAGATERCIPFLLEKLS